MLSGLHMSSVGHLPGTPPEITSGSLTKITQSGNRVGNPTFISHSQLRCSYRPSPVPNRTRSTPPTLPFPCRHHCRVPAPPAAPWAAVPTTPSRIPILIGGRPFPAARCTQVCVSASRATRCVQTTFPLRPCADEALHNYRARVDSCSHRLPGMAKHK